MELMKYEIALAEMQYRAERASRSFRPAPKVRRRWVTRRHQPRNAA